MRRAIHGSMYRSREEFYRQLWALTGSLYTAGHDRRMASDVREELEAEFGPCEPERLESFEVSEAESSTEINLEPDITLEAIGREIGVTRERVRMILIGALAKLRQTDFARRIATQEAKDRPYRDPRVVNRQTIIDAALWRARLAQDLGGWAEFDAWNRCFTASGSRNGELHGAETKHYSG